MDSETLRVITSMQFVAKMNKFSCQKAGGFAVAPSIPSAISDTMSCLMCITRGRCLGKSCLGDNGVYLSILHCVHQKILLVLAKTGEKSDHHHSPQVIVGKVLGCQAKTVIGSCKKRKQTKKSRLYCLLFYMKINNFNSGIFA